MSGMEYRARVNVPGLDVESDDAAQLLRILEQRHGELGPVLDGVGSGVDVVIATDAPAPPDAAIALYTAVAASLGAAGLGLYPAGIEVEPVTGELTPA